MNICQDVVQKSVLGSQAEAMEVQDGGHGSSGRWPWKFGTVTMEVSWRPFKNRKVAILARTEGMEVRAVAIEASMVAVRTLDGVHESQDGAMKFQEGGHRSQGRLMEAMEVKEGWHEISGWWPWKPG
jgi:hypothetical protein